MSDGARVCVSRAGRARRTAATAALAAAFGVVMTGCSGSTGQLGAGDAGTDPSSSLDVAAYVDPFVGTAGGGNTFPGAVVPWGMASPSPHSSRTTAAGYFHDGAPVFGFGNVHMSGVGCWDLGSVVLMPTTGDLVLDADMAASSIDGEQARAGSYRARLSRYGVDVELTASERVGLHRYTFPAGSTANVRIDVSRSLSDVRSGSVHVVSASEIEGQNVSGGFCGTGDFRQTVYFVARFDHPADAVGTFADGVTSDAADASGTDAGAYLRFSSTGGPIEVRVGLSYTSVDNARANLDAETRGKSFDALRGAAYDAWNRELSRIRVEGGTPAERTIFYTALYHALLHPNVLSDVNGDHPTMDRTGVVRTADRPSYTLYSMWDTYRTLHPLLALVYPERQLDMVRSLADMASEAGYLPKWELARNETHVMVGDPASIIVADSYARGLRDFDVAGTYAVMKRQATVPGAQRPGLDVLMKYGYIPMDDTGADFVWGPVSTALEYGLADWNVARLADSLGDATTAAALSERSKVYARYFDPTTKFLRPRNADGSWYAPFDPQALTGGNYGWGGPGYVEGNAWQYTFFVPHDVEGLAALFASETDFVDQLERTFDTSEFELVNEPDMAYPYLFTHFPGQAWRTERRVRAALHDAFGASAAGLPGNDDTGTLSAWYVFGALGFYPDHPGSLRYSLGSPLFDRAVIDLSDATHPGRTFVIEAAGTSVDQPYIASAALDGAPHSIGEIDHSEILAGGTLHLVMSAIPAQ